MPKKAMANCGQFGMNTATRSPRLTPFEASRPANLSLS
jgi:hypothetical protein